MRHDVFWILNIQFAIVYAINYLLTGTAFLVWIAGIGSLAPSIAAVAALLALNAAVSYIK